MIFERWEERRGKRKKEECQNLAHRDEKDDRGRAFDLSMVGDSEKSREICDYQTIPFWD